MKQICLLQKIAPKQILEKNSYAVKLMEEYKIVKKLVDETYSVLDCPQNFMKELTPSTSTSTLVITSHVKLTTTTKI